MCQAATVVSPVKKYLVSLLPCICYLDSPLPCICYLVSLLPCICHNRVTWSSSWWGSKYLCTNPGPCRVRKFFLPMTRSRRYGSPPWLLQDETSSQMLDKKIKKLKFRFFSISKVCELFLWCRYIRPKPDDRINKTHMTKMQKTRWPKMTS